MSAQPIHCELLARLGLRLPAVTLKRLQSAGIFCQPAVSIEYQRDAKSYVLRAFESGGAIAETGAYCGFVDAYGDAIPLLQRVDNLAVNGLHAIVIAPVLVRLEMVRNRLTYDLLITRHSLTTVSPKQRPKFESSIVFHGHGIALAVGNDAESRGSVCPPFYSHGRETFAVPPQFRDAVERLVAAVWCVGCRHCHLSQAPDTSSIKEVRVMASEFCSRQPDGLPTIEQVLADPAASDWLKVALRSALSRDPVDAANDAEVLAKLLDRRCRHILECS